LMMQPLFLFVAGLVFTCSARSEEPPDKRAARTSSLAVVAQYLSEAHLVLADDDRLVEWLQFLLLEQTLIPHPIHRAQAGCAPTPMKQAMPNYVSVPDPDSPEERLLAAGIGLERPQLVAFLERHSQPGPNSETIRKLLHQLGNEDFERRDAAEKALIQAGSRALAALQEAQMSNDLEVRSRATRCLSAIEKDSELVRSAIGLLLERDRKSILPFLKCKSSCVKRLCLEEIGKLKDEDNWAVPALLEALDDDWHMQVEVRFALDRVLIENNVRLVLRAARDDRLAVRTGAIYALRHFKSHDEVVLPALLAAAQDPQAEVRRAAVDALGGFPTDRRACNALAQALHDQDAANRDWEHSVAHGAAGSLSLWGKDAKPAMPDLMWAVRAAPTDDIRRMAIRALAGVAMNDNAAVAQVVAFFLDVLRRGENKEARLAALEGFSILGPVAKEAVPDLLAWLRVAAGDMSKDGRNVQCAAVYVLARIAPREGIVTDLLVGVFRDKGNDVLARVQAAKQLGEIRPWTEPVVRALLEARDDKDPEIRAIATMLLDQHRR
jgi:HEAT repeat protein